MGILSWCVFVVVDFVLFFSTIILCVIFVPYYSLDLCAAYYYHLSALTQIHRAPIAPMKLVEDYVVYPNQYSIFFHVIFHRANIKQDSLNSFPFKVSCYFSTPLIYNCKFEITTVPQIALYDNIITFNYSRNSNYSLPYNTPSLPQIAWNNPDYIIQLNWL